MLKAVTWCVKCLFLYFLVVVAAIRFSWIFTTPVWQSGEQDALDAVDPSRLRPQLLPPHLRRCRISLRPDPLRQTRQGPRRSLPFLLPLRLRQARHLIPTPIPPILWAWLPVTLAFLTRFVTWQSRNSSVLDPHRSPGRVERFFGPLYAQSSGLLDDKWITDRFLFTGPMLFLMACAIAALPSLPPHRFAHDSREYRNG